MVNPAYSKFGFDNEFFELDVAGGFNTAQARTDVIEQARAEGYAAGQAAARATAQAEAAETAKRLGVLTEQITSAQREWEDRTLRQLLTVWYQSFNHLLGQAAQHYPEPILEQHLKSLLPLIRSGEELTLRINPTARAFHDKLGLSHAHISGHEFRIVDDHSLPATDCVVEWRSGGLEAKINDHQKLIAELLASAGVAVQAPAPAAPESAPAAATPDGSAPAANPVKSRAAELLGDEELVEALK